MRKTIPALLILFITAACSRRQRTNSINDPGNYHSGKPVMMNHLKKIKELEHCLISYCKPVYDRLQKGLPRAEVESLLKTEGIEDSTLTELFTWRNGLPADGLPIGQFNICSFWKLATLDYALEEYHATVKEGFWSKNFFPIVTSYAGDYLLLDVGRESKTHGMVFAYSASLLITDPMKIYDSMDDFFSTLVACYEQGIYKFNPKTNGLEIDGDNEFKLSLKMNPRADYWKED